MMLGRTPLLKREVHLSPQSRWTLKDQATATQERLTAGTQKCAY